MPYSPVSFLMTLNDLAKYSKKRSMRGILRQQSYLLVLTRDTDIAILSVRPSRSGILWKRLHILS